MFRISRRLDYGLQLMIALAAEPENHAQATAILAEKLQIPLPFLHQIGRSLIQGRLIKATPGPHGGLRLNVPADEISLLQIVETLEGPVCISPNPDCDPKDLRQENLTSTGIWTSLQAALIEHLGNIRLSSLLTSEEPASVLEFAGFNMGGNGVSKG